MKEYIVGITYYPSHSDKFDCTGIPLSVMEYAAMAAGDGFKVKIHLGSGSAKAGIFKKYKGTHTNDVKLSVSTKKVIEKWEKYDCTVNYHDYEYRDKPTDSIDYSYGYIYSVNRYMTYMFSNEQSYQLYQKNLKSFESVKNEYRSFINKHSELFQVFKETILSLLKRELNSLMINDDEALPKTKTTKERFVRLIVNSTGIYYNTSSYLLKSDEPSRCLILYKNFGMADIIRKVQIHNIGCWIKELINQSNNNYSDSIQGVFTSVKYYCVTDENEAVINTVLTWVNKKEASKNSLGEW